MRAVPFVRRIVGALSRRLKRPELLAAVDPVARRAQREEVAIRAILASALAVDGTYVDVGTNRGQLLGEAVRIAPRGRHVAFEPIPELAAQVARSFPGVECRARALGARREQAEFCHFRGMDGWSGLRRSPQVEDAQGRPHYIMVEVSTLDDELARLTPQVVKVDVEGAELAVLEGGRGLLTRARPHVIFEHVADAAALYDVHPGEVWDLLHELGYAVFAVTGEGPYARAQFIAERGVVNWLARPAQASSAIRE
jgi:FkbM family methyltransferase